MCRRPPTGFPFNTAPVAGEAPDQSGSVGVMLDLTEKNRAARERAQKEKFIGVLETAGAVCHELNQPLQVISGYAELMMVDLSRGDKHYELAEQILEQVERIADITGKLQKSPATKPWITAATPRSSTFTNLRGNDPAAVPALGKRIQLV